MLKKKRGISLLITLTFLLSLLLPMGAALAGTTYSALTVPVVVPPQEDASLGTVLISIDTLGADTHSAVFSLPSSSYKILTAPEVQLATSKEGVNLSSVVEVVYSGTPGSSYKSNEFRLKLDTVSASVYTDVKIAIALPHVDIPATASGDIALTITNLKGQLPSGSVVVGQASTGQLDLSMVSVPTITASGKDVSINIKENAVGALKKDNSSIKFTLPTGFTWSSTPTITDVATGNSVTQDVYAKVDSSDARKLIISREGVPATKGFYRVNATISVDESTAKFGDVVATVGGASSANVSELTVAKYVDFGVSVSAGDPKTVLAGWNDQTIGTFYIEEAAPGSLVGDRTVTLTLPANAKWDTNPTVTRQKGNASLGTFSAVGTDGRTIKATVTAGNSASKWEFKDGKVRLAPDTTGDLAIEVGGSAGASGTIVVATVKAPVTVTASGTPDVIIGQQAQAAGDITLVEAKAGAIDKSATTSDLTVKAPTGVTFTSAPTVEVIDGDLLIDKSSLSSNGTTLAIEIKGTSSKASTIKISGIKYTIDRTVPVGPIALEVSGDGINKTSTDFANADVVAKVENANVVTPAPPVPGEVVTTFTIGSTSYKVGDTEQTMDVAPFVENGRTYLPIRYVAYAVGVSAENIMWDDATATATLIKGDRVVQLTINSNKMLINGATITMDVPAKMVSGRTMLPVRWVGNALGCQVDWDEDTQTVTVTQ